MRTLLKPWLLLVLFGLFFWSCKTTKTITKTSALPEVSVEQLFDSLQQHSDFDLMSAKVSVAYNSEKESRNFNLRARVKKDSVIWLSIAPAMGIELFQISLTRDTVKFLNRMDKTFFVTDFQGAEELLKLDADYNVIQSILLGTFIWVYDRGFYNVERSSGHYNLIVDSTKLETALKAQEIPFAMRHETEVDGRSWSVSRTFLRHELKQEDYLAQYSSFTPFSEGMFPTTMQFHFDGKEKVQIELNWSKLEEEKELRFPFNIPDRYEPVN